MGERKALEIEDFSCPVCGQQSDAAPVPETGRNLRAMGFYCLDPECPLAIYWVAMGAELAADRILSVKGAKELAAFHEAAMQKQYREWKRKEALDN